MTGNHRGFREVALLVLLGAVTWGGVAGAGTDIDFGAAIRTGNDTELFLAISSRYFDRDPEMIGQWRSRYRNPDDLSVALFLSARSGRDLDFIFQLRSGGLSWWDVGRRLEVRPDVWFVPCSYRPGPPYGNAYGHWRKYQRNPRYRFSLGDREVRDLVALRMVHDYYRVDPRTAMQWRAERRSVESLMSREYRKRHAGDYERRSSGRSERGEQRDKHRPGKSHGKGKGK